MELATELAHGSWRYIEKDRCKLRKYRGRFLSPVSAAGSWDKRMIYVR